MHGGGVRSFAVGVEGGGREVVDGAQKRRRGVVEDPEAAHVTAGRSLDEVRHDRHVRRAQPLTARAAAAVRTAAAMRTAPANPGLVVLATPVAAVERTSGLHLSHVICTHARTHAEAITRQLTRSRR